MTKQARRATITGVAILVVIASLIGAGWWAVLHALPVRPSYSDGTLSLTSRASTPWTAVVHTGAWRESINVPPGQVATLAVPPGELASTGTLYIDLSRPGQSTPAWQMELDTPGVSAMPGGVRASAGGLRVKSTVSELTGSGRK